MKQFLSHVEIPALIAVPIVLVLCAVCHVTQTALLTLLVAVAGVVLFFAHYETSRPGLRQIMPAVVLGALAAAGRLLFAAFPHVKPVSAIAIVAGAVFGRRCGFMVGALAALVSNFFLGQGPWTPWQMYAWGMVGYFAGVFANKGLFDRRAFMYVYGFLSALLYGLLLNIWHVVGFMPVSTFPAVILAFGAALPFDITHGVATVIFLLIIYTPWQKKLGRIKAKYGLLSE